MLLHYGEHQWCLKRINNLIQSENGGPIQHFIMNFIKVMAWCDGVLNLLAYALEKLHGEYVPNQKRTGDYRVYILFIRK